MAYASSILCTNGSPPTLLPSAPRDVGLAGLATSGGKKYRPPPGEKKMVRGALELDGYEELLSHCETARVVFFGRPR